MLILIAIIAVVVVAIVMGREAAVILVVVMLIGLFAINMLPSSQKAPSNARVAQVLR